VGEQRLLAEDLDGRIGDRETAGQQEQQAGRRAANRDVGLGVAGRDRDAGRRASDQPLPRPIQARPLQARARQAGVGGVEVQGLTVAAQLAGPGRIRGAGHDEAEPFVDPVRGEPGRQVDVPADRELGVG
jgi:hypothetical protein